RRRGPNPPRPPPERGGTPPATLRARRSGGTSSVPVRLPKRSPCNIASVHTHQMRVPFFTLHQRDRTLHQKGSAMFPCEEAKSDQSCREGAEPRRAGSPRDVGAWGG